MQCCGLTQICRDDMHYENMRGPTVGTDAATGRFRAWAFDTDSVAASMVA
jgi:hypothetical protein